MGSTLSRNARVWPPHADSARAARAFVFELLTSSRCPQEMVNTAVLLTNELVTNAILHANTDFEVRIYNDVSVRIEVRDGSNQELVRREHHGESVVGRGLALVESLASSYGWESNAAGKVVWFVLGSDSSEGERTWGSIVEPQTADVEVELRGLPVTLYEVLREHNEALLREYMLEAFSAPNKARFDPEQVRHAELAREAIVSGYLKACSYHPTDSDKPAHLDVIMMVSEGDTTRIQLLRAVFEDAERLARDGVLLTRPVLPELRRLRNWILDQGLEQLAGSSASAWQFEELSDDSQEAVTLPGGMRWVPSSPTAIIAANHDNRITGVSPAAAALLGWQADELIGRRIMAIVPPALREAHVAGFTRHLVTGRTTILGNWIEIEAWHHDGYKIPIKLQLQTHPTETGSSFVAHIARA